MATMTARDVIRAAARRAKLIAGEESMTAAEQVDALSTLNLMMGAFPSMGIEYAHTDLAIADTVNVADGQLDNLIWMAADALANGDYGGALTPGDQMKVMAAKQALQAAYHTPRRAVIDHALRRRYGRLDFGRI